MTDYIKREAAKNILENTICLHEELPFLMDEIPAADVIEVVRCKDCNHNRGMVTDMWGNPAVQCDYETDYKPIDWYCADGEKE